jgi:histidinol-phosphate aminotransferase
MARAITAKTRLVFIGCPNNPTGTANTESELLDFVRSLPDHVVVAFDEAYAEYQDSAPDLRPLIAEGRPIVCLRTFSKIYGLASLRVGYGYASAEMAALLNRVRQPFNVNAIGQAAAIASLEDEEFVERCIRDNRAGLAQLEEGFRGLGLTWVPSCANFILVRVGKGQAWFEALQRRGVIVRPLAPYKLAEWIRVTVGTKAQNERLLQEMSEISRVIC